MAAKPIAHESGACDTTHRRGGESNVADITPLVEQIRWQPEPVKPSRPSTAALVDRAIRALAEDDAAHAFQLVELFAIALLEREAAAQSYCLLACAAIARCHDLTQQLDRRQAQHRHVVDEYRQFRERVMRGAAA